MRKIHVRVPGSSANLGPGFDTLALALCLYTDLTFTLSDGDSASLVELEGEIALDLPSGRDNLVYRIASSLLSGRPDLLRRLSIGIRSDIPLGRGLGSSAAATMGAVWAASALAGENATAETLIARATAFEGHPDNVAASLLGGLTIASTAGEDVVVRRLDWPADWRAIVVVPAYSLPTEKARQVLPAHVPLADAVSNVQRTALLVSAVATGDAQAMAHALYDRLHEPYRQDLVPELAGLRRALSGEPLIGCVLSGAGSSVLVIAREEHAASILECTRNWARAQARPPAVLALPIDTAGLTARFEE